MVQILETSEPTKDFREANDNLIGAFFSRETMVAKLADKVTLPIKNGVAENGDPSREMFDAGRDKKVDSDSSPMAALRRDLPKLETRTLLKKLLLTM